MAKRDPRIRCGPWTTAEYARETASDRGRVWCWSIRPDLWPPGRWWRVVLWSPDGHKPVAPPVAEATTSKVDALTAPDHWTFRDTHGPGAVEAILASGALVNTTAWAAWAYKPTPGATVEGPNAKWSETTWVGR